MIQSQVSISHYSTFTAQSFGGLFDFEKKKIFRLGEWID